MPHTMTQTRRRPPAWYDAQYDNRARIPGHPAILRQWAESSAAARERLRGALDLPYGSDASERLDVFPAGPRDAAPPPRRDGAPAAGPGAPVLVHIHGGYWRALDKRDHSFVAPPFVAAGAMVVLPNHALCPAVSVEHIVGQLVQALAWVWRHAEDFGGDRQRIVVCGHSAGAHLAAMLLACRWPQVAPDLPPGLVGAALAISGVFDLDPLRFAPFLAADLKLTAASARRLSPAAMPPPAGRLVAVVGADESEEFLRQTGLIARAWGPRTVAACERVPGRHHIDVLAELADPASRVHRLALELLGLPAPAAGSDGGRP